MQKSMLSRQTSFLEMDLPTFNRKAAVLFSGGLDSALAVYLIKRQGIDVIPVHFSSPFSSLDQNLPGSPVRKCAEELGVEVLFLPKGPEFIELVKNPTHGYGKNLNPCIDCRIFTLVRTAAILDEVGASFIVTGEVVGQRPMSQGKNTISMIEKRSHCVGKIVRPLSARILPPSGPEAAGIVSRDQLLGIAGRGRKTQLRLAKEIGLTGFSAPAGGCLLTDEVFCSRLHDLFKDKPDVSQGELELLQFGRHFRLRPGLKVIVGRDEKENRKLENTTVHGTVFKAEFASPTVFVTGIPSSDEEQFIARILLRYTKKSARGDKIAVYGHPVGSTRILNVVGIPDPDLLSGMLVH